MFAGIHPLSAQNLVADGTISNNANWNGQEAPYNSGTGENAYIGGGCGNNYVMEVDVASAPLQVVSGFVSGMTYQLSFRYAWRTASCSSSTDPAVLNMQFTDNNSVLNVNLPVPSSQTTFTNVSFTFTNDASTTHTLYLSNPGNTNTCGIIMDDIAITPVTSPGGISTSSLSLWMNAGYLNMTDNAGVYGWISGGKNVVSLIPNCSSAPVYHTGQASAANALIANYNPYITFNGIDQYLQYSSNRINSAAIAAGGTVAAVFSAFMGGGTNQTFFGNKSSAGSILTGRTGDFTMNDNGATGTNNVAAYAGSSRVNLVSVEGKSNGITLRDLNGNTAGTSGGTSDSDYLTLGASLSGAGSYGQYFSGSLSELIVYNAPLSNIQAQQVRSYMAAKYGVTLSDNSTTAGLDERNYLATDGTTNYWTYASNSAYHNNVSVICRDDNTSLSQKTSVSTDADVNSHTGNAMLIISNGGTFSSDKSFFATGHNGISASNAQTTDVPAGIQSRMQRIWKFQKTGGVPGAVTVQFDMTGFSPLTGSDLRLLVSTTPSFAAATVITGSYGAPYFTASLPTTGGVYFTVGSINSTQTPLPIELVSFTAIPENKAVRLNWVTSTEINNSFFTVERSADAISFEPLLTAPTKAFNGNSKSQLSYQAYDMTPLRQISYYRLKQTDLGGHSKYHNIVSVDLPGSDEESFSVYPNPGQGDFFIDLSHIGGEGEINVSLFDALGKEYYAHGFYKAKDGSLARLDLSKGLAAGTYFCRLTTASYSKVIPLVIE